MSAARVDVVVVGSGAAGAALTWRLASLGATVTCLEQGDWLRLDDFASERQTFEVSLRRGSHTFNPNDRKRREDYPVTTGGAGPTQIAMWNGVGGSTVHWEGHPSRYVEAIFDEPFEKETFTGNPFFSQQFYETDRQRGFVRGYSLMVYRPFGPLSVAWGDTEPVPWGRGHHAAMRRASGTRSGSP